jgi:hypothetical protein
MSQHIKDDEKDVHSEISGSIQGDPCTKALTPSKFSHAEAPCDRYRYRWDTTVCDGACADAMIHEHIERMGDRRIPVTSSMHDLDHPTVKMLKVMHTESCHPQP